MARNNNSQDNQQLAVLAPPRFDMPAHVEQEYGLTLDTWRATIDAVFPLAKTPGAVLMALAYAKRRNVDIFARVIHIVPIRVGSKEVETVWPGIGLQRVTAHRQSDFAGWEDCVFGPDVTTEFKGKVAKWNNGERAGYEDVSAKVTHPEWAQFTFLKVIHGSVFRAVGPKVWWMEEFARLSAYAEVPNAMWCKRPRGQFEKVAEAAAARRAWPDVFGDEMSAEEVEARPERAVVAEGEYVEVSETDQAAAAAATPKRADFQAETPIEDAQVEEVDQGDQNDHDPETGEVVDQGPSLAEQAAAAAARADAEAAAKAEQERAAAAAAEPGPVPEGYETWDAWGDRMIEKMKIAASIPKLQKVADDNGAAVHDAPADVRDRVETFYQDKLTEHREAMK
jgi:hypothetical protein